MIECLAVLSVLRLLPADTATARMRSDDPFGLAPCEDRTAPGCFVLNTPFPSTTSDACELRAPPEVTLDGNPLRVLSHAFDGARVSLEVDIRSALLDADAQPGDVPSLEVRAPLACPKDTYDAATANLGTSATVIDPATPGRVSWIFPFNFFLVEEFAILADSIEALVEAGDNLQITVTGDDGSEEFLYGGLSFPLFPRDGEDEVAVEPFEQVTTYFQTFVDGAQAAPHLALDVEALGCDFFAFSGHKAFGPGGIGVLWGRQELLEAMPPWQGGGDMILTVSFEKTVFNELPYKFEAGTPAIADATCGTRSPAIGSTPPTKRQNGRKRAL